jgi:hypothetical protein
MICRNKVLLIGTVFFTALMEASFLHCWCPRPTEHGEPIGI